MVALDDVLDDPRLVLTDAHEYFFEGVRHLGVSEILSLTNCITAEEKKYFTEEARERGHYVHKICELLDNGILDWNTVDPRLWGWIDAYKSFLEKTGFRFRFIEKRGLHTLYKYCGTMDRFGQFADGSWALIDLKTGKPAWWARLQLAAYEGLIRQLPEFRDVPITNYTLSLAEDGVYELKQVGTPTDKYVFFGAAGLANLIHNNTRRTK